MDGHDSRALMAVIDRDEVGRDLGPGASPVDPLAAEVWLFDPDLTQVALVLHPWGAGFRPGGKVVSATGRRPARQHAVSCSKRLGWKPSCSPGESSCFAVRPPTPCPS